MENQMQANKLRVILIDSRNSWDFYMSQAKDQGCPVAVHFGASWCMPSVAMGPAFEEIASSYPSVLFLYVDVDDVKEVASTMEVKAMPTFVLMKDGLVEKVVGANPDEIRKRIDNLVHSMPVAVS